MPNKNRISRCSNCTVYLAIALNLMAYTVLSATTSSGTTSSGTTSFGTTSSTSTTSTSSTSTSTSSTTSSTLTTSSTSSSTSAVTTATTTGTPTIGVVSTEASSGSTTGGQIVEYAVVNYTMSFSGGIVNPNATCDCSELPNMAYIPGFACNWDPLTNAPNGNWSNGTFRLYPQIPDTWTVLAINMTLWGRFDCGNSTSENHGINSFSVYVNGLPMMDLVSTSINCTGCGDCAMCESCASLYPAFVNSAPFELPAGYYEWQYGSNSVNNLTIGFEGLQKGRLGARDNYICLNQINMAIQIGRYGTAPFNDDDDIDLDHDLDLPMWAIILIAVSGVVCGCICILSVVFVLQFAVSKNIIRRFRLGRSNYGDDDDGAGVVGNLHPHGLPSTVAVKVSMVVDKGMAIGEIELDSRIGKGSFGEVWRGRWRGTVVAIKTLPNYSFRATANSANPNNGSVNALPDLMDEFYTNFVQEAELMRSLRHPNIVMLYAAATEPELCIIMEYMERGSLFDILHKKPLPVARTSSGSGSRGAVGEKAPLLRTPARNSPILPATPKAGGPSMSPLHSFGLDGVSGELPELRISWSLIRSMMLDAAKGMVYLHKSTPPIIHRDLKTHNLLVDRYGRVKVSDFGLSRFVQEHGANAQMMTHCGTPAWTAPEVLRGEHYSESCDVFSFGVVLWECVSGLIPWEGVPQFQIVYSVGTQRARLSLNTHWPTSWRQLILECWSELPVDRPTFEEIVTRLERMVELDEVADPMTPKFGSVSSGGSHGNMVDVEPPLPGVMDDTDRSDMEEPVEVDIQSRGGNSSIQ